MFSRFASFVEVGGRTGLGYRDTLLLLCRLGQYRPGVGFQMNPAFLILKRANFPSVFGNPADKPLPIPQFIVAGVTYLFLHPGILFRVCAASQISGKIDEMAQGPVMQKRHHGAFAAAQIQTVVPVRPKPFADSAASHLPGLEWGIRKIREKYRDVSNVEQSYKQLGAYWEEKFGRLQIQTPQRGNEYHDPAPFPLQWDCPQSDKPLKTYP